MRVETVDGETGLAVCVDGDGRHIDVLTALVPDVRPGDQLLVHAGTALLRLESSTEAPA
jgi:hydrogenase maturation factor